MPMPNFMRHINKRFFNRRELAKGDRPVITHTGRTSGRTYRTPLEALRVDGGYAFVLMYGSERTDWVKNVLASGRARLAAHGDNHDLVNPRIETGDQAWAQLAPGHRRPAGVLNVSEVLFMDHTPTG